MTPPATQAQVARLLECLADGETIDQLDAWEKLGTQNLADAVSQLQDIGYPVKIIHRPMENRFGESCQVAECFLARAAEDFAQDSLSEAVKISEAVIEAMDYWESATAAFIEQYGEDWTELHASSIGQLAIVAAILATWGRRE